ncbi:hypothetical protein [Tahibacter amnicola]|uniref:BNR repeat protein n=1 Tax=Tahibacter amnicola TaxID=2976241 RepID=A0ABY6BEA1_9GAMM|nr:hypothetical protein [Tahibacter amnicola]UXI68174.1 hypothetical protein N4264_00535 [Tahibacter amnicola]
MLRPGIAVIVALGLAVAPAGAAIRSTPVPLPMQGHAAQPGLDTDAKGDIYLSWIATAAKGHQLRFSRWDGKGFTVSATVAQGTRWFVNWADVPGLRVMPDGALVAWWLEKTAPGTYAYGVRLTRSADGGRTWSDAVSAHADSSPAEHGFVSLWPMDAHRFALVWLDGRDAPSEDAHDHGGEGATGLRTAVFSSAMQAAGESLIDARVCDCCQTDVALARQGPVVVFRDRSEKEIRDIAVVRWDGSRWSTPRPVHADNWTMPGCPVNGPAVAARGDDVYVAWYTAPGDQPTLRLARSTDGGASFAAPVTLPARRSVSGRVDLALVKDAVWVSWLEETDEGAFLMAARYTSDLSTVDTTQIATLPRGRGTGVPRLAPHGDGAFLVWTTVTDGQPQLRAAQLSEAPAD